MRRFHHSSTFPHIDAGATHSTGEYIRQSLRRSRWLIRPLRSSDDVSFLYLRYFRYRRIAYRTVQQMLSPATSAIASCHLIYSCPRPRRAGGQYMSNSIPLEYFISLTLHYLRRSSTDVMYVHTTGNSYLCKSITVIYEGRSCCQGCERYLDQVIEPLNKSQTATTLDFGAVT